MQYNGKHKNLIFILSIILHGIVSYCMELLCILWYRIVFMSFHCIIWYCMVLYYILRYCMVLHCWLRRAGCISQDTYLLYIIWAKYKIRCCSQKLTFSRKVASRTFQEIWFVFENILALPEATFKDWEEIGNIWGKIVIIIITWPSTQRGDLTVNLSLQEDAQRCNFFFQH